MSHITRLRSIALAIALFWAASPRLLGAGGPPWWAERGVLDPAATPADYAAVNQGQLKHIATAAFDELNAHLPGGAGSELETLINLWSTTGTDGNRQAVSGSNTSDYSPVNLGMLKAVAKPFYDRLIAVGFTGASQHPWLSGTSSNASDYALANIGQVKQLFAFDLVTDANHDGIPDSWEQYWSEQLGITVTPGGIDPASGLTLLQEFLAGHIPGTSVATGPASAVALQVYTPLW